jgi:hypothetical protein
VQLKDFAAWRPTVQDYWEEEIASQVENEGDRSALVAAVTDELDLLEGLIESYLAAQSGNTSAPQTMAEFVMRFSGYLSVKLIEVRNRELCPAVTELVTGDDLRSVFTIYQDILGEPADYFNLVWVEEVPEVPEERDQETGGIITPYSPSIPAHWEILGTETLNELESTIMGAATADLAGIVAIQDGILGAILAKIQYMSLAPRLTYKNNWVNPVQYIVKNMNLMEVLTKFGWTVAGINDGESIKYWRL